MSAERSAALVRRWVAFYTLGLPPEIKQDRRDEIDDDLWCQVQEAAGSRRPDRSLAGEIIARLVFGIPADVSWRVEKGRLARASKPFERSDAMHARLPAVLALVGGAAWSIWPVHAGLLSMPTGVWASGFGPTLTLLMALGGTVVLALAVMSLVAAAHDMIPSWIAALAVIGALISTLAVLAIPPAFLALPLSSLLVVWRLSRVGALPRWVFWMHAAAPIFALAIFVIGLVGFVPAGDIGPTQLPLALLGVAVLYLYPLSWLAIGWSLLRGTTVAMDRVAGAGAV
jgi:hypothetical protein